MLTNLLNINGSSIISFSSETTIKPKAAFKHHIIKKKSFNNNVIVFGKCGVNGYQNMVNRRLQQEGKQANFQVGVRKWGTAIKNTCFVLHKDQVYLDCIFLNKPKTEYYLDDKLVDYDVIKPMIYAVNKPKQNQLENTVQFRTFKLSNIISISALKKQINITENSIKQLLNHLNTLNFKNH